MTEKHQQAEVAAGTEQNNDLYWRENLKLLAGLLSVWFVVSFGFGIVLADVLNQWTIFGVKLGFWFAQQGSILVFVVLIFFYAWLIGRLDNKYHLEDKPTLGAETTSSVKDATQSSPETTLPE